MLTLNTTNVIARLDRATQYAVTPRPNIDAAGYWITSFPG
jgi:hypothetical protein